MIPILLRTQCFTALACSTLLIASVSTPANELAEYRNHLTLFSLKTAGPVLDGRLDDPCWNNAHVQRAKGFVLLMDEGKIETPAADTEVMSCYDETHLYIAAKLHEPGMDKLKVSSPVQPWMGDCIEVFVDPAGEGRDYFQFITDTVTNTFSGFNDSGQIALISFEWSVKVAKAKNYWSVEMALPFESFGVEAPADNERWDFNVGRERYVELENSAWATMGGFSQRERFGQLAFYSRHEIVADMSYWENSDADPLMRRKEVSGIKMADRFLRGGEGTKRTPDLWSYFPYEADRGEKHPNGYFYEGYLNEETKANHPEFYQAAMDINRLLVQTSFLEEKLRAATRAAFYGAHLAAGDSASTAYAADMEEMQKENSAIQDGVNEIYQFYGRAYDADRSVELLSGLDSQIETIASRILALEERLAAFVSTSAASVAGKTGPWKSAPLELSPDQLYPNDDGTSQRYQFTAFSSAHTEPLRQLGPFDGFHIDHPISWPITDVPGEYKFPKLRGYIDRILRESGGEIDSFSCTEPSYRGLVFPMTDWILEKARRDPDLLLQTEPDKQPPLIASTHIGNNSRLNVHNPEVWEYVDGYLKNMAVELLSLTEVDYFLTGWEGSAQHVGYNPSIQSAFRDYLKERYRSIEVLNKKWRTDYASFEAVEVPYHQYSAPDDKVSGLTYEFERWHRLNYVRRLAAMRQSLKKGAPDVPVMPDPSHFMREGNTYLMYREKTGDLMSHHSSPGKEEPMWVYLETMNRTFGMITGYFENYFSMWSKAHLNDERLARRDLTKFFFKMFLRDVRVSAWWLRGASHPTAILVAYNGNTFNVDYQQTIYRWSMTSIPVMFRTCRSIEKALLETRQEIPGTAIIQPCASVFNLASMKHDSNDSDTLSLMFDLHNKLLSPLNVAHDYLPEEMVLDGKGSLDDYTVLFLPYAPYMSEELSNRLTKWVKKGGTLFAVGPFALQNEFDQDLADRSSLFKTLYPDFRQTGPDAWDYSLEGKDERSQPQIQETAFGKGRVVHLNRMLDPYLRKPALKQSLMERVEESCERTAVSPDADLEILVREGENGEKYLGLCNKNVEKPLDSTVTVKGRVENPVDLLVPGFFPVPSTIEGDTTELKIYLEPGDWTLIRLPPAGPAPVEAGFAY
jgi:hypothetical protein